MPKSSPTLAIVYMAVLGPLSCSTIEIIMGPKLLTAQALIDSGNSESFISDPFVKKRHLAVTHSGGEVSMVQPSLSSSVIGLRTTTVHVGNEVCRDLKRRVLPSLCTDIILGLDFMQKHKGVKTVFRGSRDWVELNKTQVTCSLEPAAVESPRLFSNLSKDYPQSQGGILTRIGLSLIARSRDYYQMG